MTELTRDSNTSDLLSGTGGSMRQISRSMLSAEAVDQLSTYNSQKEQQGLGTGIAGTMKIADLATDSQKPPSAVAAPEGAAARLGTAAFEGLSHVPEGMWNEMRNTTHNNDGLKAIGMGICFGIAVKNPLIFWKILAGGVGTYLAYDFLSTSGMPVVNGFKMAAEARTMQDLNLASTQIGRAGGALLVDSLIAASAYKLGAGIMSQSMSQPLPAIYMTGRYYRSTIIN